MFYVTSVLETVRILMILRRVPPIGVAIPIFVERGYHGFPIEVLNFQQKWREPGGGTLGFILLTGSDPPLGSRVPSLPEALQRSI
jgi:hypothetical protein